MSEAVLSKAGLVDTARKDAGGTAPRVAPGPDGAEAETLPALGRAVRHLWSVDSSLRFLNHGSFGATPRELLAEQDGWRARMEANPVQFVMVDMAGLLREAAAGTAAFVGTEGRRLAFVENATSGAAAVLHALDLQPGDRIVTTGHVYNALRNMARHVAARCGADYVEVPLPAPLPGPQAVHDAIAGAVDGRTRLVMIDHVASASALELPVAELARWCRERGVPLLVDGAHGPGMLDLDVDAIGADWYVGNAHKWLCAPKGAAFIAVADRETPAIRPAAISHAYGQGFPAEFDKVGTRDATAWLCVPSAIAFHKRLGGAALRRRNRDLARKVGRDLAAALGREPAGPEALCHAMVAVPLPVALPATRDVSLALRRTLLDRHGIELAVTSLGEQLHVRLSVQAYNEEQDYADLGAAVLEAADAVRRTLA